MTVLVFPISLKRIHKEKVITETKTVKAASFYRRDAILPEHLHPVIRDYVECNSSAIFLTQVPSGDEVRNI